MNRRLSHSRDQQCIYSNLQVVNEPVPQERVSLMATCEGMVDDTNGDEDFGSKTDGFLFAKPPGTNMG